MWTSERNFETGAFSLAMNSLTRASFFRYRAEWLIEVIGERRHLVEQMGEVGLHRRAFRSPGMAEAYHVETDCTDKL